MCLAYFYVMHVVLLFVIFMHLHLACHLGALDESREGHDVGANPKTVLGGPIPKEEGLSKCCDLRCHQDGATNSTDSVLIPGKPRSIISLPLLLNAIENICYMYCCIKYRS